METNIDDCSGEILSYTMDLLFQAGALDVFYTPVFMKKNRPAYLMTVTCRESEMEKLCGILFRETTTIGIRYRRENRVTLPREQVTIETGYGTALAKKVTVGEDTYVYPEYESLKKLAQEKGVSLKELYRGGVNQNRPQ